MLSILNKTLHCARTHAKGIVQSPTKLGTFCAPEKLKRIPNGDNRIFIRNFASEIRHFLNFYIKTVVICEDCHRFILSIIEKKVYCITFSEGKVK